MTTTTKGCSVTEETKTTADGSGRKFILLGLGVALLVATFLYKIKVDSDLEAIAKDTAPAPRTPANAPYIKTDDVVVNKMIEVAKIKPGDLVYDLGCGDGRIVIAAAMQTGCRGLGLELDPEIAAEARQNVEAKGVSDLVTIREQDVFKADLKEADCVLMYVLPWMIKKLIPQFQELKPGTRIVSHNYGFGGNLSYIEPDERYEVEVEGDNPHRVYVWVTPLKVPADHKSE
jgi:predicted RNA methylase